MTDLQTFVVLVACKGTLILGLVAALVALAGRHWPQHCILWQRLGIVALLALPVAVSTMPSVGIPVWSAPGAPGEAAEAAMEPKVVVSLPTTTNKETASRPNAALANA